ncbi:replication-relaxation family protein [Bacillus sp. FJAT-49736]|uniref:replication-relaxation family protein n=1 Tax=Bacillus sp. FJAT-49736 TaxID=2833582 RepID=UPI001BCA642D|nr:replication-relaxation family protein [Bacillus sp. FJAT-49736]MBS4172148.1 replication-relaxation family protein [Bacillus sp. FJAT-49736]
MDYLTRAQIQAIHNLKGDRNANRILADMSEYLGSFRHEIQKVYHLNKAGRERVKCEVERTKTQNIQHYLIRNQLWIYLRKPHSWKNEMKIKVKEVCVVADAMFYVTKEVMAFVEVDVSQSMKVNRVKMDKYRKIKEMTGNEFHVVWITEIESRRLKLKELMQGMPGRVYTFNEIK